MVNNIERSNFTENTILTLDEPFICNCNLYGEVLSGSLRVFGYIFNETDKIVITNPLRCSVEVQPISSKAVLLIKETKYNSSIKSKYLVRTLNVLDWYEQAFTLSASFEIILVSGACNAGKSTFVRYLLNSLIKIVNVVALLDLDPGQPLFGLPQAFNLSFHRRPLLDLSNTATLFSDDLFSVPVYSKSVDDFHACLKAFLKCFHKYGQFSRLYDSLSNELTPKTCKLIINYCGYDEGYGGLLLEHISAILKDRVKFIRIISSGHKDKSSDAINREDLSQIVNDTKQEQHGLSSDAINERPISDFYNFDYDSEVNRYPYNLFPLGSVLNYAGYGGGDSKKKDKHFNSACSLTANLSYNDSILRSKEITTYSQLVSYFLANRKTSGLTSWAFKLHNLFVRSVDFKQQALLHAIYTYRFCYVVHPVTSFIITIVFVIAIDFDNNLLYFFNPNGSRTLINHIKRFTHKKYYCLVPLDISNGEKNYLADLASTIIMKNDILSWYNSESSNENIFGKMLPNHEHLVEPKEQPWKKIVMTSIPRHSRKSI